jgi:hypothetical protein
VNSRRLNRQREHDKKEASDNTTEETREKERAESNNKQQSSSSIPWHQVIIGTLAQVPVPAVPAHNKGLPAHPVAAVVQWAGALCAGLSHLAKPGSNSIRDVGWWMQGKARRNPSNRLALPCGAAAE